LSVLTLIHRLIYHQSQLVIATHTLRSFWRTQTPESTSLPITAFRR
jgi:hypothetical protein